MDLSTSLDHLDEIIWIYLPDSHKFAYLNAAVSPICGFSVQQIIDKPSVLRDSFDQEEINTALDALAVCLKKGYAATELRISDMAEERWLLIKGRKGSFDGQTAVIGSATDITLQKRIENSFVRFTERYDKILQSTLTGYVLINLEGFVVNCNASFAQILETEVRDMASQNFFDIISPQEELEELKKRIKDTGHATGEFYLESSASTIPVGYSASIIHLHDRDLIVFFLEDISSKQKMKNEMLKVMERSEEVSKMKTSIMANLTHEIKSPIQRILGLTEIISKDDDPQAGLTYLNQIKEEGNKVLESLTALLEFSRLDSQIAREHFKPMNLWNSVISIREEVNEACREKNINLQFHCNDTSGEIEGDIFLLKETWKILVGNAIKFSDGGTVDVTLTQSAEQFEVKIKDEGAGIESKFIDQIFEPFAQESNGLNRTHEGLGLGLTIAKRYVESHRGSISIDSVLGKGTTVRVVFPRD